jgi:hypothetical protein
LKDCASLIDTSLQHSLTSAAIIFRVREIFESDMTGHVLFNLEKQQQEAVTDDLNKVFM